MLTASCVSASRGEDGDAGRKGHPAAETGGQEEAGGTERTPQVTRKPRGRIGQRQDFQDRRQTCERAGDAGWLGSGQG